MTDETFPVKRPYIRRGYGTPQPDAPARPCTPPDLSHAPAQDHGDRVLVVVEGGEP